MNAQSQSASHLPLSLRRPKRPLPELPNVYHEPQSLPRFITHSRIPCPPMEDAPIDLIYDYYNVSKVFLQEGVPPPPTLNVSLTRNVTSHDLLPTHALAVFDKDADPATHPHATAIIPISADAWARRLTTTLIEPPNSPPTAPHARARATRASTLTLPIIPFTVPHAASLPLLLISALGILPPNRIASALLPPAILGELPACPAILSHFLAYSHRGARRPRTPVAADAHTDPHAHASDPADALLRRLARQNSGMWKNVLALGVCDGELSDLVEMAWNVTAEAQRLRFSAGSAKC